MKGAGLITPAVSQVGITPAAGAVEQKHRKQGVSPGIMFIVIPKEEMAPP